MERDPEVIREAVLRKWSREGFLDDIKSDTVKMNTAIILENQYQYLNETGGTATNDIAKFKKIVIPMVRRIFPHLITNDVVGVQPMLAPVGLAYALRRNYEDGSCVRTEAGFNLVDRDFSGTHHTSAGERLGDDNKLCPVGSGGSDWAEMSISIESVEIRAKTRKLRARFSMEVQQDLMAMHNVDVRQELTDLLSYEIGAEIDQEVLQVLKNQALGERNLRIEVAGSATQTVATQSRLPVLYFCRVEHFVIGRQFAKRQHIVGNHAQTYE